MTRARRDFLAFTACLALVCLLIGAGIGGWRALRTQTVRAVQGPGVAVEHGEGRR